MPCKVTGLSIFINYVLSYSKLVIIRQDNWDREWESGGVLRKTARLQEMRGWRNVV